MTWADTTRHTLALLALFAMGCSMSHMGDREPGPGPGPTPGVACGSATCAVDETCCPGCGAPYCTHDDFCVDLCPDGGPVPVDAAPAPGVCWGGAHDECGADMYCRLEACGAGDAPGRCVTRPMACDFLYAPVCSCEGETFPNRCAAEGAGANVAYTGECDAPAASCGGETGPCTGEHEVCDWHGSGCGTGGGVGVCIERPDACEEIYAPVCGCDGVTYSNECSAHADGVEVDFLGTCDAPAGRHCGGWGGGPCEDDEFCEYTDAWCDWADASGRCQPRPTSCTGGAAELVCGCDGAEYGSECAAQQAGVDVAFSGSCADP